MKFKNLLLLSSLSLLLPLGAAELIEHTVTWEGAMPAQTHNGTIQVKSLDAAIAENGSVDSLNVVLDMTTIANTDLSKDKNKKKLEGHLKSEDFFYVEKHPTASFELKKLENGSATGNLIIRGVSQEVTVPLTVEKNADGKYVLTSKFSFDRQKFNVNYQNSGFFGTAKDKLIKDDVDVSIHIVFTN